MVDAFEIGCLREHMALPFVSFVPFVVQIRRSGATKSSTTKGTKDTKKRRFGFEAPGSPGRRSAVRLVAAVLRQVICVIRGPFPGRWGSGHGSDRADIDCLAVL